MTCFCDNTDVHIDYEEAPRGQIASYKNERIPWEGTIDCAHTEDKDWSVYWPHFKRAKECCVVAVAADFYLLEHVIFASGVTKINHAIAREFIDAGFGWNNQIQAGMAAVDVQQELEANWGPVLRDYLHYACVAEMSHSWAFTRTFPWDDWGKAFRMWGKTTKKFGRTQAAQWAVEAFENPWESSAFGGRRWADIAKVLLAAETGEIHGARFDYHLFLDRVFSLQHNTGCVFSKYAWNETKYENNRLKSIHLLENMSNVLDAHHEGDIYELHRYASPEVQAIHTLFTGDSSYDKYAKARRR